MSIFRWTAPVFKLAGQRWSEDDFRAVAEWLHPFVSPGGVLMDLGGGTGDLGAGVARALDARVVIVDPTPQMLAHTPARPFLSVRLGAAEEIPFPDGFFDAVLVSDALHHFRDSDSAAREMRRTVRPGGGVVILEMEGSGWGRLLSMVERLMGEPATFKTPAELTKLLAAHDIVGDTIRQRGISYAFIGSVRESGPVRDGAPAAVS
jgi:ubiquinone/menaquinone biosynthesis C-methylase UbiE